MIREIVLRAAYQMNADNERIDFAGIKGVKVVNTNDGGTFLEKLHNWAEDGMNDW